MKSFKNISFYLNSKFRTKIYFNQTIKEKTNKKIIYLYSVGSHNENYRIYLLNYVIRGLNDKYIFKFTKDFPDYLIYDVYDCKYLDKKYNNSIKISFFTENQIPDFNQADYAISFHNLNYLDRYLRKTTLLWNFESRYLNIKNNDLMNIRKKTLESQIRTKFCGAVISNFQPFASFRINFINSLNKYKKIDMGGKYMNNIGGSVKNKIKFLSSYKFSIAMENSEGQGYISEKILESFLAGTIPIYYGGYMIDEYINPKAFILIRDENDMKKKIEYIKKIDNDINLYKKILKENIFISDNLVELFTKEKIEFFNNIFMQELNKARRIDNYHFRYR